MGNRKITLKTIKNREGIHPYSRKAHQISRVHQRKEKLAAQEKKKSNNPIGERWIWFRYAFDEDKSVATKADMHELIEIYLTRHDEEIDTLESDRNKGHRKPKTPRQELLESIRQSEMNEYVSGMELPDMTNGRILRLLRDWDGDKNSMKRITTIRLQKPTEPVANTAMAVDTKKQKSNTKEDMMEL
ncbi:translation machinery-associated protein 16 [Gilbertella persicaria]|uniref:Translation machinery-associated protein 16 n=1 Tax=Rhizopus stolonifer TaxID=4846 RepID=A0A367JYX5_RHIST|nr:translation machinery-associated protein 16 [Gilbertella persicaria]KAI8061861.1 translation machinery-associated protein 16 [Gilbertella persicaria]RCH95118.1 hypothetical protein CU098_003848 [Rhizopus stolonifer]